MSGETVLIIDDSVELTATVEAVLRYGGYEAISASTGQEGLEVAAQWQPDVILIDLELPDTSGLKVVEQFNDQGFRIPTIMMTGYGSEGTAARALRLGVRDYLIKPFTTEEVLSSIDRALEESRLRKERDRLSALVQGHGRCLDQLGAVCEVILAGNDLACILQTIVEAGHALTGAEAGFLLLLDEGEQQLRVAAACGQSPDIGGPLSAQVADQRLGPVLQKGAAVRLHAAEGAGVTIQTGCVARSVLQVPLASQGHVLGLIAVDRLVGNSPFGEHDEQLLKLLAGFAAMALAGASGGSGFRSG